MRCLMHFPSHVCELVNSQSFQIMLERTERPGMISGILRIMRNSSPRIPNLWQITDSENEIEHVRENSSRLPELDDVSGELVPRAA